MDLFQEIRLGLIRSDYMVDGATDLLLQVELNTISTILHLPMALLVAYLSFIGQEKGIWDPIPIRYISFMCWGAFYKWMWIGHRWPRSERTLSNSESKFLTLNTYCDFMVSLQPWPWLQVYICMNKFHSFLFISVLAVNPGMKLINYIKCMHS